MIGSELPIALEGRCLEDVNLPGQRLDIWVSIDPAEVERRESVGLGGVDNLPLLRALAPLPVGRIVPWDEIHPLDAWMLGDAARGVVEVSDEGVTRLLRPPLRITGLIKDVSYWRDVRLFSYLAQHGPRLAVAREALGRRIAASPWLDIGVIDATTGRLVHAPGPTRTSEGPRSWSLLEAVYDIAVRTGSRAMP